MPVAASKPLKQAIEFYSRILPQYITAALQQWAMVSKEKMARALDYEPGSPHTGVNNTAAYFLVPTTMHLPPSSQVSQLATQCSV